MSVRFTMSLQTATTSRFGWEIVHWIGIWAANYARAAKAYKPQRATDVSRTYRLCGRVERLVLPHRIELWTSPLPRGCSTTELRQHAAARICHRDGEGATRGAGRNRTAPAASRGLYRWPPI